MIVYLNGRFVEETEASVSIFDRGLSFGDSIYETLRAYNGKIFALEDHLDRLRAGCAMLRMRQRSTAAYWRPVLENLLLQNGLADGESRIRITISRGTGLSLYTLPQSLPTEIVFVVPLNPELLVQRQTRGVRARIASSRRAWNDPIFRIKSTNLVTTVVAYFECWDENADEAIILNTRDEVCEATTSNVFVVKDGQLFTPPTSAPCLPGVTRQHLMYVAHRAGYAVSEEAVPVSLLLEADEIFTCSSISELMPLSELEGRPLQLPGPVTSQLQLAWSEYTAKLSK